MINNHVRESDSVNNHVRESDSINIMIKEVNSNLYSIVLSTRNNPAPIWGKPNCIYPSSVAFVSMDTTLLSDVPYLKISV